MLPVNILHIIGGGEIGGAEQHVLTLLGGLDKTRFAPHLVCLVSGPFAALAQEQNIPTETIPMRFSLDLSPLPGLLRLIRQKEIRLVHTHGSRANLLGRLAAKRAEVPCVSTVHSSLAHDYLSAQAARLALALDRRTLSLTAEVITVSEYLADEVASRYGRRPITVYNGQVPLPLGDPGSARRQFRSRWAIPADAILLGTIGRLHPAKGHTYFIRAAARLLAAFPNLHLLLIGDGPRRQELESELKSSLVPYTLTGYLPQAWQALPAMDLFVLPSVSEGMGLVLLEAMQAGIPIVASAAGGIPEIVRHEKDGLLAAPENVDELSAACARLLVDPGLARALAESAQNRRTSFSLTNMLQQTEQIYTRLISDPPL